MSINLGNMTGLGEHNLGWDDSQATWPNKSNEIPGELSYENST